MLSGALCNTMRRTHRLIDQAARQISSRLETERRRLPVLVHARRMSSWSRVEGRWSLVFTQEQSFFQYGRKRDTSTSTTNTNTPSPGSSGNVVKDGTTSRVTTSINSGGICHVILNRPEKLNALDLKMFEAIAETASKLRDDRSIRAVILRGEGRAFCTGLDVKSVMSSPQSQTKRLLERPSGYNIDERRAIGNLAQDVSILWRELPVPVLAVLHGMCFGGGLQIALGADMRYSTPDCKLSIMESKYGLVPDMGASITLRDMVRIDIAKELTFTGRVINGEQAQSYGLVTHCCEDPLAHAETLAKELVRRSPDAIASAKRLYQASWTETSSEKECLQMETDLQAKLLASWNQVAASGRALGWEIPYFNRKDE